MKPTVLIIGGGLTGLTAAYRLQTSGRAQVTVVEKGMNVGGLAGGFTLAGAPLEKTYHHLFRTDTDILKLLEELGLSSDLEWHESSMAIYLQGKPHPFGGPADVLRFSPIPFLSRVRLGLSVLFLQKYRNWKSLSGTTAAAWMRKWSGPHAFRAIWNPLLTGKFSEYAERVSMAWLWARIHIRANSRDPQGGKEKLGYPRSGFQRLSDVLKERIQTAGGTVRTSTEVKSLTRKDSAWHVTLEGETISFDKVAFTGSSATFARLLDQNRLADAAYLTQLRSIPYLGAACLIFSSPQDLGTAYWTNINEAGAPFLVFINHTRLVPASRYGNRQVYYIGAYLPHDHRLFGAPERELADEWFTYLKKLYPEFDAGQIVEKHLFRFTDAQHVVDTDYAERRVPMKTPLPDLWLANFSQIFPEDRGTNYAVRDGEELARQLFSDSTTTS